MDYKEYWDEFLEKELNFYDEHNKRYLKKGYLHFDYRIWFPEYKDAFKRFILDSDKICKHSFLPFLKVTLETKRIKFNPGTKRRQINIKPRPICYAAHKDALIYSFYSTYLSKKYEEFLSSNNLEKVVLAYRSLNLCNIDFAKEVFSYIESKGECVAIALDIRGFFDNLEHNKLKEKWLQVININSNQFTSLPEEQYKVFKSLTQFAYVEKQDLLTCLSIREKDLKKKYRERFCEIRDFREKVKGRQPSPLKINKEKGIPQGSPISAVLSNIYMLDYDLAINQLLQKYNFLYRRYCDDVIVVCALKDFNAIRESLYRELDALKLEIQPDKEEVIHFLYSADGKLRGYKDTNKEIFKNLQYLGFEFNGQNVYIRSSSISRFHRRMKAGVRETIKRGYGRNAKGQKLFKKRLFDRFTHLGGQNFLSYAYRANKIINTSDTIKKQLARHFKQLTNTIQQKTEKHLYILKKKGKITQSKD